MSEIQAVPLANNSVVDLTALPGSTVRKQLLGASLFPLVLFGMLSILVTASALYELTTRLALERNTAQAQAYADELAISSSYPASAQANLAGPFLANQPAVEQLLITDDAGNVLAASGAQLADAEIIRSARADSRNSEKAYSISGMSTLSQDQIIVSFAPIPNSPNVLVLAQRWSFVLAPALYYQLLLVALLLGGILLSIFMLSSSIGRIMQPITELAATASRAVPGSIFHPVPERGPIELRSLTASFNNMVIQLAEQQATLREFAHGALLSQEDERLRLSRELHDETVQDLVGLAQRLELCRTEMDNDPLRARRRLDELRELTRHTLDEVRQMSNALRPSILQDLGLPAALRVLCQELEQAMPGIACECRISQSPNAEGRLQPDVELAIFRVAQEALTNIRKHAGPVTQVCLSLELPEGALQLEVQDNGLGAGRPDIAALVRDGHLGYAGMQERARLFGGTLDVLTASGGGTIIRMHVPL